MCLQIPVSFYGRIPGVSLIPSSIVTPPSDCQYDCQYTQNLLPKKSQNFKNRIILKFPKHLKPYYIFSKYQNFQKFQNFRVNHNGYPHLHQLSTRMWHILYLILYVNLLLFPNFLCKTWYIFSNSKLSQNPVLKYSLFYD